MSPSTVTTLTLYLDSSSPFALVAASLLELKPALEPVKLTTLSRISIALSHQLILAFTIQDASEARGKLA